MTDLHTDVKKIPNEGLYGIIYLIITDIVQITIINNLFNRKHPICQYSYVLSHVVFSSYHEFMVILPKEDAYSLLLRIFTGTLIISKFSKKTSPEAPQLCL
jgi:hypothetical protein